MLRRFSKKTANYAAVEACQVDWQTRAAAHLLACGGVVVHPTEAVYGLAASAYHREACEKVARLKQRPAHKSFIVIAADVAALSALVCLDLPLKRSILASWPGPHTWVLPARRSAPVWLPDRAGRIAVRVTAHGQAAALCQRAGPLISTSANPAGRRPAKTALAARHYFGADIDRYLAGPTGLLDRPTSIRDGVSGTLIRA